VRAPRAAKEAAPKQVTVLDLKRCTAIGIKMARLRVPWQAAADAILSLDAAAFEGAEDVATVMQCLPTEDERNTLQARGARARRCDRGRVWRWRVARGDEGLRDWFRSTPRPELAAAS
jgi:hypothetical protein